MRILADENIDRPIVAWLRGQGHDVVETATAAPEAADADLIAMSRREGRILMAFDRDIGGLVQSDASPCRSKPPDELFPETGMSKHKEIAFEEEICAHIRARLGVRRRGRQQVRPCSCALSRGHAREPSPPRGRPSSRTTGHRLAKRS
jgi:hypothetical protein